MQIFRRIINRLLLSIFFLLALNKAVFGLNPETHQDINGTVAQMTLQNGFSLNDYLITRLGISNGIKEEFNKQTVRRWLELGGEYEDKPPWSIPYLRSLNHFHNPITEEGFQIRYVEETDAI